MSMTLHSAPAGRGSLAAAMANGVDHLLDTLAVWRHRVTSRRELSRLDDRMLRDIGISQFDAEQETSKHFWQD